MRSSQMFCAISSGASIDKHLPRREFEILKVAEASERKLIKGLVGLAIGDAS